MPPDPLDALAADEDALTRAIVALASEYGRYGYRRVTALLQAAGWRVGKDRVQRIWRREGLKVPSRHKPRSRLWLNDGSCVRLRPLHPNHVWSFDFVQAQTQDGRSLRVLTLVDEHSRACLALKVARRIGSLGVIEALADAMCLHGIPEHIRCDNGPEMIAKALRQSDTNRPQLQRAIQACRVYGARLLIAKFDRLSRDAHFLLGLKKAGIEFVATDNPHANRLTVGIMALVADEERRAISARTKAALAAAKARGVKLGGDRGATLSAETRAKGVAAVQSRAEGRAADLAPVIAELRASGATSLRALAAGLTRAGIAPPRGSAWSPMAVSRTLARIEG